MVAVSGNPIEKPILKTGPAAHRRFPQATSPFDFHLLCLGLQPTASQKGGELCPRLSLEFGPQMLRALSFEPAYARVGDSNSVTRLVVTRGSSQGVEQVLVGEPVEQQMLLLRSRQPRRLGIFERVYLGAGEIDDSAGPIPGLVGPRQTAGDELSQGNRETCKIVSSGVL